MATQRSGVEEKENGEPFLLLPPNKLIHCLKMQGIVSPSQRHEGSQAAARQHCTIESNIAGLE